MRRIAFAALFVLSIIGLALEMSDRQGSTTSEPAPVSAPAAQPML
jgi:hypothetical protein